MASSSVPGVKSRYASTVFDSVSLYSTSFHSPDTTSAVANLPENGFFHVQPFSVPVDINDRPSSGFDVAQYYLSQNPCVQSSAGQLIHFDPSVSYITPDISVPEVPDPVTPSLNTGSCSPAPYSSPMTAHVSLGSAQTQYSSGPFGPPLRHPYGQERRTNSIDAVRVEHLSTNPTPISSPHPAPALPQNEAEDTTPQSQRRYAPIAPSPAGIAQRGNKRSIDWEDDTAQLPAKKRQYSISSTSDSPKPHSELSDEDALLLKLKEEEGLTWKDVASRFQSDLGKSYHIPALQMRLKRLKERLRTWTESEVHALRLAHEYWLANKWEIIASKMADFGANEKWTHKQCCKKWDELSRGSTQFFNTSFSNQPLFANSPGGTPLGISLNTSPPSHEDEDSLNG